MSQVSPFVSTVSVLAQEQVHDGPQGPEFGKAAPVGLLVIVGLLVAILAIGVFFNRRMKKMKQRQLFAELHGLDPFDIDAIDRRMAQEGAVSGRSVAATDATLDASLDASVGDENRLYGPDALSATLAEQQAADGNEDVDNEDPAADPSTTDPSKDAPR
ncbi:MAG: hypothetical protein ACTH2K_08050 [Candidatus Corynebacterium faecigallinarum]|uniref:hypothetical protein n=1 Tax=Candidatus Corynebacterium faecigallinarum TaxID=2838528 RepID=UPI003FB88CFD